MGIFWGLLGILGDFRSKEVSAREGNFQHASEGSGALYTTSVGHTEVSKPHPGRAGKGSAQPMHSESLHTANLASCPLATPSLGEWSNTHSGQPTIRTPAGRTSIQPCRADLLGFGTHKRQTRAQVNMRNDVCKLPAIQAKQ